MFTFSIEDTPKNSATFPVELKSSTALNHGLNCGKLLHGRARIVKISTNIILTCRYNYSTLKTSRDNLNPRTFVREFLGNDIDYEEGIKIISALRNTNTAFFKKLEAELSHCLFAKLNGEHLLSFLHMYRSIEKLSAAFPLIYISSQQDFGQSINNLREYFGEKGGELSFASKFSKQIAENNWGLGEYNIDFKTKISNLENFQTLLAEIKICCPKFIEEDHNGNDNGVFSVPFEKVPSFIIYCRNRMFHFTNDGQRNFDLDRIEGPSELCRMLVEAGLHWITLCYDEVFRRQASRLVFVSP